jgi:hypothetical protein
VDLYFSQYFDVTANALENYGALDISIVSDLPLFVDPFLLFNSDDPTYQVLHDDILRYLLFLRDRAADGDLNPASINTLYRFPEVEQNWLGFTLFGNSGAGLGREFAFALHGALRDIFADFGNEKITSGTHLEKLCLIRPGIGKDNISDFTTNLIKGYLCEYTQAFAREHIAPERCATFVVDRAAFNYETETWARKKYYLPRLSDNFVLLTPLDILTRDDTWINQKDMISKFAVLPAALPNAELRAQVNRYFKKKLGLDPDARRKRAAAAETISKFPELIDRYIKLQEDAGNRAQAVSSGKVQDTQQVLVDQLKQAVSDLERRTKFYDKPWTSYDECLDRAKYFKGYIENNDGYRLLSRAGRPFSTEAEVQLAFGLVWCRSEFDINREPNNGRGPVDFKASYGSGDKSLIEFKLGSNKQLERNLAKQVAVYEAANQTWSSVKVIIFYTAKDERRVKRILKRLGLDGEKSVVLIDARSDNKPSASKA